MAVRSLDAAALVAQQRPLSTRDGVRPEANGQLRNQGSRIKDDGK